MQYIGSRSVRQKLSSLLLHFTKIQICSRSPRSPCRTVRDETNASNIQQRIPEKAEQWSPQNKRVSVEMRKVEKYVFTRYFDHVKIYDKVLGRNFPSAFKAYRIFFDGVKEFFIDMKSYLKVSRIVNESPKRLKALNRKELELYMRMPRDMFKVAPAIIGSSLPIFGYLIFPIVFMYPSTFLTSHFWTVQQCIEFRQLELKYRLQCSCDVLRQLQDKLKLIVSHQIYEQLEHIYSSLGSGMEPTVEEILAVKEVFAEPPYNMGSLSNKHLKFLMRLHGLKGLFKDYRLHEHAFLLHYMDLAICREGDVHNMTQESLRYSCFIRGLNPDNLSTTDMIYWLRKWITISTSIEGNHISMFLHLPILLGLNHPNNWQLVYRDKNNRGTHARRLH